MQVFEYILQQPAPAFKATAVVDGAFKDISLSEYTGVPDQVLNHSHRVSSFTHATARDTQVVGWLRWTLI